MQIANGDETSADNQTAGKYLSKIHFQFNFLNVRPVLFRAQISQACGRVCRTLRALIVDQRTELCETILFRQR
jgi:hypothetical protein